MVLALLDESFHFENKIVQRFTSIIQQTSENEDLGHITLICHRTELAVRKRFSEVEERSDWNGITACSMMVE